MVPVKGMAASAQKYTTRAQAAQQDFVNAVAQTPPATWESATIAAKDAFSAGVTAAVARGSFEKGVTGSGGKWARRVSAVGGQRYATGVAGAGPDWTSGFQPYHDALVGLQLGPRGPRGDARNTQRAVDTMNSLHQKRITG